MKRHLLYILFTFCYLTIHGQGDFKADVRAGCGPLSVRFTDLTPKAAGWNWDFGNSNTGTTQNPTAIYTSPGSYTISLRVVDSSGKIYNLKKTAYIVVFKNPTTQFTISDRKVCPGDSLWFTETSIMGDTSLKKFSWDFGDGSTSALRNPPHAWTVPGYKNISLIVTDNHGCSNQLVANSYLRVLTPPLADFIQDSTFSCAKGLKVNFTNTSSPAGYSSLWDFGDGSAKSNATDPTHFYPKFGQYHVTLKVWDKNTGCHNSKTVYNAVEIDSLKVHFDAQNKIICDKINPAVFSNQVIAYPDYKATWRFGDGQTSTDWAASHTYTSYGVYAVTLEIKGSRCFAKKTISNLIKVNPRPALSIRANDTGSCGSPFTMKLIAKSPASSTVTWDFGDAKTGTGNTVSHVYQKPDSFFVTAIATDKSTCKDTQKIWIKPNDLSVYAGGTLEGCIPLNAKMHLITFTNTASITKIEWFYKNTRIDSGITASYKCTDTGIYKLKLRVINSKGCVDSPDIYLQAGIKIKPSFSVSKHEICLNDSITFTNTTPSKSPVAHSFGMFVGEGAIFTSRKFTTSYQNVQGKAQIIFMAKHYGCVDTFQTSDSVLVKTPRVAFTMPQMGCTIPNPLAIVNNTSTYTQFKWFTIPAEQRKNKDTIFLNTATTKKFELHMIAINDTNNCADSAKFGFNFTGSVPSAHARYDLIKPCPPAEIQFIDSNSLGSELFWKLPNGDTLKNTDVVQYSLPDYGTYICKRYAVNKFPWQTCIDSSTLKIVIPKPDARFSFSPTKGCTPLYSTFVDSGYFKGKKGIWKMSDTLLKTSSKSNVFTFVHPFDSLKTNVTYTAWDSLGKCSASTVKTVELSGPKASISGGYFYTCKITKLQLSFTKLSNGIKSWQWFADDTALGNSANPEFIVYTARNVNVELKITDSSGCTSSFYKTFFVRVYKPDVKISSDTSGALCPPLVVHFFDKSTSFNNPIESWLWDFGDGSGSTIKNPSHTFINTGTYNIKLTVKNFVGCFATVTFPAYIRIFGPKGSIVTGSDSGCTPLKVHFRTTTSNLKNIRWDFGDGVEGTGTQADHFYNNAGNFVPSAILEDSNGCTLGVQANFKVKTTQTPLARVKQLNFCDKSILNFTNTSDYFSGPVTNFWKHENATSNSQDFSFQSIFGESDSLLFIAFGSLGCNDTLHIKPRKSNINLSVNIPKNTACIGESILFKDQSTSDTSITRESWQWGKDTGTGQNFNPIASNKGFTPLKLVITNAFLCSDSLKNNTAIYVGDSIAPGAPLIHVVTVTGDQDQELKIRPENTPDWIGYALHHANSSPFSFLQNHTKQSDTLFPYSGFNSNLNPQCYFVSNINLCRKESYSDPAKIHCTIELKATGDTNKIDLKWSAYRGDSIIKYYISRADLPVNSFNTIDSVRGDVLTYTDTAVMCSRKYSYRITAHLQNSFVSHSDTAVAYPLYKNKSLKPHIHHVTVEPDNSVMLVFEPVKNTSPNITFYTLSKSISPSFVYTNIQTFTPMGPYVYSDKSVNPDSNIYHYRINTTDACGGVGVYSEISNNIRLQFVYTAEGNAILSWNRYKFWIGKVNHYELQQKGEDQIYRTVQITTDTSYSLTQPGKNCGALPWFRIKAISNQNSGMLDSMPTFSISNTIELSDKPVYFIPNTFTPNHDALNQVFKPSLYWVKNLEMEIFNRWGEKIYEGKTCDAAWDATYNGQPAPEGTYVYRMKITGTNRKSYYPMGTFHLIR